MTVFLYSHGCEVKADNNVIIVIDPGHGGSNLGTNYLPIAEKYYNMDVALAMKERLEEYDNVTVYLTHTEDIDMSLEERAIYAEDVNADFLYSLHFNMSEYHTLYGSEVWVPSTGRLYSKGYSQALEFTKEFRDMGLFDRGIKTRVSLKTGDEYYGIIRHCSKRNIPAVIVEHCHVDHYRDEKYIKNPDYFKEFGKRDADAVARYFGLSSSKCGIDNSLYTPTAIPVPASRVHQDKTGPENVKAELIMVNRIKGYASFEITGYDNESDLLYYSYSTNGGATWSLYQPWCGKDKMTVTVKMNRGKSNIMVKIMNRYDQPGYSDGIMIYR